MKGNSFAQKNLYLASSKIEVKHRLLNAKDLFLNGAQLPK